MSSTLCTYIVKNDSGLAPNPFWRYCTLAVCTPNHMGVTPRGDEFWIAGFSGKEYGNKLVYAMRVDEFMGFNQYYDDPRFAKKKPNIRGTWRQIPGDNMYYLDASGNWKQHKTIYHTKTDEIAQDLKYPMVFMSKYYFYFGEKAVPVPQFGSLIHKRQGVKCDYDETDVVQFTDWLHKKFSIGIKGFPRDRRMRQKC